jgi:endonuclease/exonuclease/phosphatase family metal-dependent hydrolase
LLVLAFGTLMGGCNDGGETGNAASGGTNVTLMTYNVLSGAGADTVYPWNLRWAANHEGYSGNRLPQVLAAVKAANPDILGVEEAHQWDLGKPPVAQSVAEELGMQYFLGRSTNPDSGFANVVIFSKFPILSAESFSSHFTRAALHAELQVLEDKTLHVFVVHLDANSSATRSEECRFRKCDANESRASSDLIGRENEPQINEHRMSKSVSRPVTG